VHINLILRILLSACFSICLAAGPSPQDITVPVALQYELTLKILTFDRHLKARVGHEIVFGIAYEKDNEDSQKVKDELLAVINELSYQKVENIPLRPVPIAVGDEKELAGQLRYEGINILYVAPMRAFDVREFAPICRAMQIMSLTGVPRYVELGVSLGFGVNGKKMEIIINLRSARAEGTDFSSKLLNLARVIKAGSN
jgi:hypothetical protein